MTCTLLLIHGWGFAPAFWSALRGALPDLASETVDLGYFGPPSWARPQGKVVIVGHSTGALLALRSPPPNAAALVAINGFDHFVTLENAPGVAPRILDRMIARLPADPAATVREFRVRCGDDGPVGTPDAARLAEHLELLRLADDRATAAEWELPLLHLTGGRDPILPPALRASSFARAPHFVRADQRDGGHLLPLTHPDWCAGHIRALAASL